MEFGRHVVGPVALRAFYDDGDALAAANAHGGQAIPDAPVLHFINQLG
jgi:hypothetical protein